MFAMRLVLTGHRPEKIPNKEYVLERAQEAYALLQPSWVICGLAAGWDLWAGELALDQGIKVCAVKPWTTHTARKADIDLYNKVWFGSKEQVVVTEKDTYPGPWVYQKRNEWMVDHGNAVLACWDGSDGGTANCLKYAAKKDLPVLRIDPNA